MKFSLPSTSVCYIRLVSVVYFACPRLAVMDLIYKLAVNCLPPVHQAKLNTLLNCFSHNSECTYNVNAYSYAYVCQHNSQYIAVLLVKENHTPTKNVHEVVTLCVDPKHRKKGHAKQLMQEFVANTPQNETVMVQLDATAPTYQAQQHFFDMFGFKILQSDTPCGVKNDRHTNRIVQMQLSQEACVSL